MSKVAYINHISFVIDKSSSMHGHRDQVIKVVDDEITYLAERSRELDQETRVTVYFFADGVECIFYEKDVLRTPSIRSLYSPYGWTALIDATLKSQEDLAQTAQLYGDHAFLTYVWSDGQDNRSRKRPEDLRAHILGMPDNWTLAALVPNQSGVFEAKNCGFPAQNISVWNTRSATGFAESGAAVRAATETFMQNRASGIRGSRSLFSTGADAVNVQTVRQAGLQALPYGSYQLIPVPQEAVIKDFVESTGHPYRSGSAYYAFVKAEKIQPQKKIAVVEKASGKVYTGSAARDLLGLPDLEVRVKPDQNPDYTIYVQSTSVNRKLTPGTKLLLMT